MTEEEEVSYVDQVMASVLILRDMLICLAVVKYLLFP